MNREDLELYVMGMYDGDVAALERALAADEVASAIVADEARLDLLLRDAAAAAAFCPACGDLVQGARCDACGAAIRPGGYAVERVLVSNAHGRMYVARDADGKQVALKELAFVQSPSLAAVAAFEREAKFLRALEHPAIPRFCASFQEGDGVHARYYLAQELVEGEPLDGRLDDHFFSEPEIVGIARQVLDVLVYLQGLSPMVIHRDIKPANLLVRKDGTIAVVDFGAAHVQGSTAGSTTIGTFGYMPIEQLAGVVDATTDLYALGASLLHLLTRREPWRLLQGGELTGLNVGRPMRAFLAKLVAPEPRDRFASAALARAAIDRVEAGRSIGARPVRRRDQPRWVIASVIAAVAAVASGGGFAAWSRLHAHRRSMVPPGPPLSVALAPGDLVTRDRMITQLGEIADTACRCTEKRCTDAAIERLTQWSSELARTRWDGSPGSTPEVLDELRVRTDQITTCLTRVATMQLIQSGDEAASRFAASARGRAAPMVDLPLRGLPVHDAVRTIAVTCDLDVVVPGQIAGNVTGGALVPCDQALATTIAPLTLALVPGAGHVVRIAPRSEPARPRPGADPLPPGASMDLDVMHAPVRSVLQRIARAGGVEVVFAGEIDSTVTVHATRVPWNDVLTAVLDASGSSYRFRDGKLVIAPGRAPSER